MIDGQEQNSVRVEKQGPVTTVILDRIHARNAVDRPTADALRQAFKDFEADDDARVAGRYFRRDCWRFDRDIGGRAATRSSDQPALGGLAEAG